MTLSMAERKKTLPILERVEIERFAAEGKCVTHFDSVGPNGHPSLDSEGRQKRKVLFVPFAAPGDVCDVQVMHQRSSYAEGKIVRLHEASSRRATPQCPHFGVCGGCSWQHVDYREQCIMKRQQVIDALSRIGHCTFPEVNPICECDNFYRYRNKMEFTFSSRGWVTEEEMARLREAGEEPATPALGFHLPEHFDKILDIYECHLADAFSDELRLWIKQYAVEHHLPFYDMRLRKGLMRGLVIRTTSTGEAMVIFIFGERQEKPMQDIMDALREAYPALESIVYVVNDKQNDAWIDLPVQLHSGQPYIFEEMGNLHYKIGPKSFYQTNSKQAFKLYSHVQRLALGYREHVSEGEPLPLVYDLYTGAGTIANFVAHACAKVIGIDYVASAIEDARENAQRNGIDNTEFYAGDMKDVLTDAFVAEHGRPDVIITDPPRAGMHPDVIRVIMKARPLSIVYVSCNVATQARDLETLLHLYYISEVNPVDMFPHTAHVENIVRLELRTDAEALSYARENDL